MPLPASREAAVAWATAAAAEATAKAQSAAQSATQSAISAASVPAEVQDEVHSLRSHDAEVGLRHNLSLDLRRHAPALQPAEARDSSARRSSSTRQVTEITRDTRNGDHS
jgi:hypothetical protein